MISLLGDHAVKVMEPTGWRGKSANLMCVRYTMQLRRRVSTVDATDAFFPEPETNRILRVGTGNQGLTVCARAALPD